MKITESEMKYHVTKNWDGGDLESLAMRVGDDQEAMEIFCDRWPEAGEAADLHIHCIFLYASLEQAIAHQENFGGEILEINDEYLEIREDPYEGELYVRDEIEAEYIKKI
jgi:hypothetical protein